MADAQFAQEPGLRTARAVASICLRSSSEPAVPLGSGWLVFWGTPFSKGLASVAGCPPLPDWAAPPAPAASDAPSVPAPSDASSFAARLVVVSVAVDSSVSSALSAPSADSSVDAFAADAEAGASAAVDRPPELPSSSDPQAVSGATRASAAAVSATLCFVCNFTVYLDLSLSDATCRSARAGTCDHVGRHVSARRRSKSLGRIVPTAGCRARRMRVQDS